MRYAGLLAALVLLAGCGTGTPSPPGSHPAALFDPTDGCSTALGPVAIRTAYVRTDQMFGYLNGTPPPRWRAVEAADLAAHGLPQTLDGLPAQSETGDGGRSVDVFYGHQAARGFVSDLAATGGLVMGAARTGVSAQRAFEDMDSHAPQITQVMIGGSVGWVVNQDADQPDAPSRPLATSWVSGGQQLSIAGVRQPAELVAMARRLACGSSDSAPSPFAVDAGCDLKLAPLAVSDASYRMEEMFPGLPPTSQWLPVTATALTEHGLPSTVGDLPAQEMVPSSDGLSITVYYGFGPSAGRSVSYLASSGNLIVSASLTQGSGGADTVRPEGATALAVGAGSGWIARQEGDQSHPPTKPLGVFFVSGDHRYGLIGLRDPAVLVVVARRLACAQAS